MNHTTGPWEVHYFGDQVHGPRGRICTVDSTVAYRKNILANATLISAAPELLDACKTALLEILLIESGGITQMTAIQVKKLANIIDKAEGRPCDKTST